MISGGSHWTQASWRAGAAMLRVFWKLARQLFHETVGALFGIFAVYGGVAWWKETHVPGGEWMARLALGYAAMMAIFSILSFRSARRVR